MAHEIYVRKRFGKLVPADRRSEDILSQMSAGKTFKAKITQPRNVKHHRKLFALLDLVFANQEYFQSIEELLYAVKMKTGHVVPVRLKGMVGYMPKSISFAKMNQIAFEEFYNKVLLFVAKDVLNNIDSDILAREVEEFLKG